MDIKEFEIPVPWGYIAVKAWGNEQNTPILCIHGLSDNAGTFDRLLPFLPSSFYYICIDLPSHGKSSHFPPHLLISALDNLLVYKIVVDYLNRKKYILMGHSWGGQTAVLFTQLYPEYVLQLIVLDSFYLYPVGVNYFKETLTERFNTLIKVNEQLVKRKPPLYTYEEALNKLIENRMYGEIFKESAEALLKRCLVPVEGDKFRFSTDPRLKAFINPLFDIRFVRDLAKKLPITCPILFVICSDSEVMIGFFKPFVTELRKRNKKCRIEKVRGSHDVHNNSPEIVGPIVTKFLLKTNSKL